MLKKLAALATFAAILAIGFFTGAPRSAHGFEPPPNDSFAGVVLISKIPFDDQVNTADAGTSGNDPVSTCGAIGHNVWYKYTPTFNQTVDISTAGSNFDTVVAVFHGQKGALTQDGCNDDSTVIFGPSFLKVLLQGGTTYYIQAGGYAGSSGSLNLDVTPQDPFFFDSVDLKCYQAKLAKRTARFQRQTIITTDQNLRRRWETTVTGLSLYCNRATVNLQKQHGGAPAGGTLNLGNLKTTCYAARDARSENPPITGTAVFAQNDFGDQKLVLGRLESICVLALKAEGELRSFSPYNGQILRCYTARPAKGSPRFQAVDIRIFDQFKDDERARVLRPVTYCNLSSKSAYLKTCSIAADCGGGSGDSDGVEFIPNEFSVVCYSLRQASFGPRNINVIDQFIDEQFVDPLVTIRNADRLCVSSNKKPPFAYNDDFINARQIELSDGCLAGDDEDEECRYADHVVTLNATRARNDPPMFHCESVADHDDYGHSVWYAFTASDDFNHLDIDTEESSYDTIVAVYSGSKGSLTQLACNDDDDGPTSDVEVDLQPDQTYYIMVGSWDRTPGGKLKFNVEGCDGLCDDDN